MIDNAQQRAKLAAALVWYAGGLVLALKGWRLLVEAEALQPGKTWPWLPLAIGVIAGGIKARFLFARACRRNLERIAAMEHPAVWKCFRPRFFIFLLAMVAAGGVLSRSAHGSYTFLMAVAALDLTIATALLGSSYVFWADKITAPGKIPP